MPAVFERTQRDQAVIERDSDWIWEALALGEESLLIDADIEYFDWNGTHEKYGTPLIALVVGKATGAEVYDFATGSPEKLAERLNIMRLALMKGASPHVKPPLQFSVCKSWWKTEGDQVVGNSKTPLVNFNDKSAYGAVASCLEALTNVEGDWKRELKFLRDSAKILATYRPTRGVTRVAVAESVLDLWDKVLNSPDGTDVAIVCNGCRSRSRSMSTTSSATVPAHAAVLRNASRCLSAMLGPAFKEGSSEQTGVKARVEVSFDKAAVKLLLSAIYTGEEPDDVEGNVGDVLDGLELAHQWDVPHAVECLEASASRRLDAEHFGATAEVATRLQLQELSSACVAFAKTSADVQRRLKASEYCPAIQALLAKVLDLKPEARTDSKRKRRKIVVDN